MSSVRMSSHQNDHTGSSLSSDASRGIMYHCRMQYLKSREGGSRKSRRKGSLDILGVGCDNDKPQFPCLDERIHAPCSSEILVPPNELQTRTKAFRQAYWRYHCQPTLKGIKKLEFSQLDERTERLNTKRREILTKIQATEKARRETELRRRAERVMNHSVESEESDESDSEIIASPVSEQRDLGRVTFPPPIQAKDDKSSTGSASSNRKKLRSSMIGLSAIRTKRTNDSGLNLPQLNNNGTRNGPRRTLDHAALSTHREGSRGKENGKEIENDLADNSFSFLSDWGKQEKRRIRW